MRLAVLADIHSNVYALDAVLDDLSGRGVDQIVDLGDIVYGPIEPRATLDRLATIERIAIRGNQDRTVAEASADEVASNPTVAFVREQLTSDQLAELGQLPFDHRLDESVYLCHGSPTSDVEYLVEDLTPDGRPRIAPETSLVERLAGRDAELVLCGHTHIPQLVALSTGQWIVNPGSIGLPAYADDVPFDHAMETFSPHASYAIVERRAAGWCVEQIRVPYDHQRAAAACRRHGREDWAIAIATGRAG